LIEDLLFCNTAGVNGTSVNGAAAEEELLLVVELLMNYIIL